MSKEAAVMLRSRLERRGEDGQILVLFVLAIVVVVGMIGLVLDGGSAYAQRRDEQNVADLASIAGATAYLNTQGSSIAKSNAAHAAAQAIASTNGYSNGTGGVVVNVIVAANGAASTVRVNLTAPHRNNFAGVMGMPTWDVSVTATATSSAHPNGALGAMPLLFNAAAFPGAVCDESSGTCSPEVYQLPGTGNEDVPQDATQFNWTIFCTANGNPCNANSDGVRDLIDGGGESTVIYLDDDIGPLNAGSHTTLFDALEQHLGSTFPVPIVNNEGEMVGWAYFKLLATEGSSDKVIRGYFVSPVNASQLVVAPGHGDGTLETGTFVIKLID